MLSRAFAVALCFCFLAATAALMRLIAASAASVEVPWVKLICAFPIASSRALPRTSVLSMSGSLAVLDRRKFCPKDEEPVGEKRVEMVVSEIATAVHPCDKEYAEFINAA